MTPEIGSHLLQVKIFFPTSALSESGSRVEVFNFLSAGLPAPLFIFLTFYAKRHSTEMRFFLQGAEKFFQFVISFAISASRITDSAAWSLSLEVKMFVEVYSNRDKTAPISVCWSSAIVNAFSKTLIAAFA